MRGPLTLNPWQRKLRPLPRMKVCHTSSLKNYLCIWLVSYVSILLDKLYNLKFYNIDNIKYMMHCCPHWNLNVSNTCMTLNDYFFFFWTDGKLLPTPILFTLRSIAKENDFIPASRDLFVGCVRTMAVSQKKVRLLSILFQLLIHLCAQIPFQFIQNLIHVLSLWQPW